MVRNYNGDTVYLQSWKGPIILPNLLFNNNQPTEATKGSLKKMCTNVIGDDEFSLREVFLLVNSLAQITAPTTSVHTITNLYMLHMQHNQNTN